MSNARFWLVLVAAVVIVTVLIGGGGETGPPLDPRSVGADGTRGFVETLERLGADVTLGRSVPGDDDTAALLLIDRLTADDRDRVDDWVVRGGTLVVADPASQLAAPRRGRASVVLSPGDCDLGGLADIESITGRGVTFDRAMLADGAEACFGDEQPYVVASPEGDGTIVSIGGTDLFTNAELGRRDNAYVAVGLVAPDPSAARITVLGPSVVAFGDRDPAALVPQRATNAIFMALASFLLYVLHRSRRLGGVVAEPQPVRIEGSELVLQAGVLARRASDPAATAETIRRDFLDQWARTLATPDRDVETVQTALVQRVGIDRQALDDALSRPVDSDHDLLAVVMALDAVSNDAQPSDRDQKASS